MVKTPLTVRALQAHIKAIDHHPDKKHEVVLKLFEEVGELSVEMRHEHQRGLTEEQKTKIKYELYDVLHYVTHIANIYGIDLEEAIREKDALNAKKYREQGGLTND